MAGEASIHSVDSGACAGQTRWMNTPLSPSEIEIALSGLPGWKFEGDALEKTFKFHTFREAMSFIVRLAFEAEAIDHHPDLRNVYNRVTLRLNTHDADGKVTAKDVDLARRVRQFSWVE